MISSGPPGSVHGADNDRRALFDVASTGAECNNPASPTIATAAASSVKAFPVMLLLLLTAALASPQPTESACKVVLEDRDSLVLIDDAGEVIDHRREGLVAVDHLVPVHVVGTQIQVVHPDGHGDDRASAR